MGKHVKKWDRCFDKLKDEKGESGAAAICSSSIDNAGLKAENQKRDKKDYYSNKKKSKKKLNEKKFSTEKREKLAKNKKALADGSFPIENVSDLKNAIKTYGLAKDKNKAKNWIKKRAKELNAEKELPKTWVNENEIQNFRHFINEEIEIRKIEDDNDEEHYNFSIIYDNYVDNVYTTIDNLKKEYDGSDVVILQTTGDNHRGKVIAGKVIYRDGEWFDIEEKTNESFYSSDNEKLQTLIDDYYFNDHADVIEEIAEITGLNFDQIMTTLDISTYENAIDNLMEIMNENVLKFSKFEKVNENKIVTELQKAIEDYYHNAESLDIIVNLTDLDEDIVLDILENSYHRNALENLLSYSRTNESEDSFQGGGAYPGPNLTNGLSGHMVGSGSDGRLAPHQTEIEGGDDSVTSKGEFPLKYKRTVQHVKSRESKKRLSALKKIQKVNMMSFSDFNKSKENTDDN